MFYISTNRAYIKVAIAESTRVEINKWFWIILCSLTVNLVHVTDYRVKEADVIVNPTNCSYSRGDGASMFCLLTVPG